MWFFLGIFWNVSNGIVAIAVHIRYHNFQISKHGCWTSIPAMCVSVNVISYKLKILDFKV